MAGPSTSSYHSILENRFGDWESTLKDVSNEGYASSEESLNPRNVKVFAAEGKVWYREHTGMVFAIEKMGDIPGKTMHLRKATRAHYAGANSLELARVEALTDALYSGSIKITGSYACVNHIGTYPSDSAPTLKAETPVPIKLQRGQDVLGMTGYHEVIVAKKVRKKIHVCHIKSEYSPSDHAELLNQYRIYFAGALEQESDFRAAANSHYDDKQYQIHLGTSREVKTEKVAVTILGLTNGLIATLYSDYMDGVELKYSSGRLHTIDTLITWPELENLHMVWESDEGRHIRIFSKEEVKVVWQYDTTIWLSDRDFAVDRCFEDRTIQKAARQFKNLTLESYAKMIGCNTLDFIAAYQRRPIGIECSVSGNACYLFQGDYKLAKDCLRASPMRREELEGVALVSTPYGDYSLKTGAKVMYSRGEGGVWHIVSEGDEATVPDSDLVGAEVFPIRFRFRPSGPRTTQSSLRESRSATAYRYPPSFRRTMQSHHVWWSIVGVRCDAPVKKTALF